MGTLYCWMTEQGTKTEDQPPSSGTAITGAVGQGGANLSADVRAVQTLLNLASAAVRSPSKTVAVDGLVGPATIGAIREFQTKQLGFNDGRVDPGGPTLKRLNALVVGSPRKAADTVRLSVGTRMGSALEAIPIAQGFVMLAGVHIQGLLGGLRASGGDPNLLFPGITDIVNTHFHLDRQLGSMVSNLTTLARRYNNISQVLSNPTQFMEEGESIRGVKDKDGNEITFFATAAFGGFHPRPTVERVVIRPAFAGTGLNTRAAILIHECAHYVGGPDGTNAIRHNAVEFPIFDGQKAEKCTNNYKNLTTDEAMQNASTYACFAIHAATGTDSRFGLRNPVL